MSGTHVLETAGEGACQDTEKHPSQPEGNSLAEDDRGETCQNKKGK